LIFRQVLGVSPGASHAEIKQAYFGMAKKYHPDVNQNSEVAAEKFRKASEAWEYLSSIDFQEESTPPRPPHTSPRSPPDVLFANQKYVDSVGRFVTLQSFFPFDVYKYRNDVTRFLLGKNDAVYDLAWAIKAVEHAIREEKRKSKLTEMYASRLQLLVKLFRPREIRHLRKKVDYFLKGKDPLKYDLNWARVVITEHLEKVHQKKVWKSQNSKKRGGRRGSSPHEFHGL
jgi:hypothetical protein